MHNVDLCCYKPGVWAARKPGDGNFVEYDCGVLSSMRMNLVRNQGTAESWNA